MTQDELDLRDAYAAILRAQQRVIEEDKLKHLAGGPIRAGDPVVFKSGFVFAGPSGYYGDAPDDTIPLTRQPDGSFSVPKRLKR